MELTTTPKFALVGGHRDMRMLFRYAHPQRQRILEQMDKMEMASAPVAPPNKLKVGRRLKRYE